MSSQRSEGKTLKAITLGCRVNQYETEYVRQGFERLGYRNALDGEAVDLCVFNTCTVTAESEAKSRKLIRRFAKLHPRAEIIVMGCYATRAADEVVALPGVVEVITDKRELPNLLRRRGLVEAPAGIERFEGRRRAYVKVQDGCPMRCSYCIVPLVRPHVASRSAADVLDEVCRLVRDGHREIVLTGVHLGLYGAETRIHQQGLGSGNLHSPACGRGAWGEGGELTRDQAAARHAALTLALSQRERGPICRHALSDLVRQLTDLPGDFRVRLSSIESPEVTPELIALMAERPDRICPHLHVPLQSGSDSVLERMNRRWAADRFIERCRDVQAALNRPAITTDVIVGFPGETEADFAATCRVLEEVGFAKVHAFRFSPRDGTAAATMRKQICNRTVQRRAAQVGKLGKMLRHRYLEKLLGHQLQVLVEGPSPYREGFMVGTSEQFVTTVVAGGRQLIGQLVSARAARIENGCLWGS